MSCAKNIPASGRLETTTKRSKDLSHLKNQFNVVDGKIVEVKTVIVHSFIVGDAEDPDLYAAQPLIEWEKSEKGQWIMQRAIETPMWHRQVDHVTYGYKYAITAKLTDKDYTFWTLKWAKYG